MPWWQFALLGGAGGAVAEFVALFRSVARWQAARRSPSGRLRLKPAAWREYVDVPAHAWMFAMRTVAGMASAGAFAAGDQIKGAFAAVALGYGGPVVLERLGQIPLVESLINGGPAATAASASGVAESEVGSLKEPEAVHER